MSAKSLCITLALAVLPVAAAQAEEDAFRQPDSLSDGSTHTRPMMASGFVGLPFSYGFTGFFPVGLSGRFYIPLLADGFLQGINDEIGLDVGVDFAFFSGAGRPFFWVGVPVEGMWQFHIVERFAAYVKLGVVLGVASDGAPGLTGTAALFFSPIGAAGLNFKLTGPLVLRFELGYPWAKVGLGVTF